MIELIELQSQNVVGVRVSGKIDKTDIEKTTKAIEDKLAAVDRLRIYVELESFGGISIEALVEDIRFAFPHLRNFEKKAVVSEKGWVEKLIDIGDKLFPSIEVRHFSFDQKDEAIKWVQS